MLYKELLLDHDKDCLVSSPTKVLDSVIKLAVIFSSSLLIACDPLIFGGVSGLGESSGGSSPVAAAQCSNGPADLSGVCRNTSAPTMGALEAFGSATSAATSEFALNVAAAAMPVQTGSTLNITWSPYPGNALGYFIYYGPTSDTATTLVSDLSNGSSNFDASAPSAIYQPTLDLGMNTGDTVCFRIIAYDTARVPYDWSHVQCAIV
jgi:hypothetical protein